MKNSNKSARLSHRYAFIGKKKPPRVDRGGFCSGEGVALSRLGVFGVGECVDFEGEEGAMKVLRVELCPFSFVRDVGGVVEGAAVGDNIEMFAVFELADGVFVGQTRGGDQFSADSSSYDGLRGVKVSSHV